MEGDEQHSFESMISIALEDNGITAMSISASGRDVALGSKSGIHIVDLKNPYDVPRFIPHSSEWELADIQFSPWPSRSEWIVSTSNQKAIVFNLALSPAVSAVQHTLHAHSRAITDVNWNSKHPELLATSGLDGWIWTWDLRDGFGGKGSVGSGTRNPTWGVCDFNSGATQIKWNRVDSHILASSHGSKVHVWDNRFGAVPVQTINAHSARIYGIDWSRRKSDALITCSLDHSFKYWTTEDSSSPLLTVRTASPVLRARYLPFGRGVLTLPQRGDNALSIWSRTKIEESELATPVARFEGARDGIKEFVWRTRGGHSLDNDDREFQLVTWSKDNRLRLWPISDSILSEVGHIKNGPITVKMSRRNAPDISYSRPSHHLVAPPVVGSYFPPIPISSPLAPARSSALTDSILSASPSIRTPSLLTSSLLSGGFASIGTPRIEMKRKASATMTTTRVRSSRFKADERIRWMEGVRVTKPRIELEEENLGDTTIGMKENLEFGIENLEVGTEREGGETAMGGSLVLSGSKVTGTAKDRDLGSYVNLGEEITCIVRKYSRINFEKVNIASRSVTISLYSPFFLRSTFHFPKSYPQSSPPTIDIEKNSDTTLKTRALLLQSIRKLMEERKKQSLPSFELALRFLLSGHNNVPIADEEDDEDDDGNLGSNIVYNVPPPRRGAAVFSRTGKLVVFFPTDISNIPIAEETSIFSPTGLFSKTQPIRLTDSFGSISIGIDNGYVEEDENLIQSQFRMTHILDRRGSDPVVETVIAISTTILIKDYSALTLLGCDRIVCSISNSTPAEALRIAVEESKDVDPFLNRIWSTLETLFQVERGNQKWMMDTLVAERVFKELFSFLKRKGDIQLLGIIATIFESYRRLHISTTTTRDQKLYASTPTDYFNHHSPRLLSADGTPLASIGRDRLERDSTWASFFSDSVLSLRSHGSDIPSPDQLASQNSSHISTRQTPIYSSTLSPPIRTSSDSVSPFGRNISRQRRPSTSPDQRGYSPDGRWDGRRSRNSPNVTFGKATSIVGQGSGYPLTLLTKDVAKLNSGRRSINIELVEDIGHDEFSWWLEPEFQNELEILRLQYAEFSWDRPLERVQILKLCRTTTSDSSSTVEIARACPSCSKAVPLRSICNCGSRQREVSCVICHLPVIRLSATCHYCLHVTHIKCARDWFREMSECATGCGCIC